MWCLPAGRATVSDRGKLTRRYRVSHHPRVGAATEPWFCIFITFILRFLGARAVHNEYALAEHVLFKVRFSDTVLAPHPPAVGF